MRSTRATTVARVLKLLVRHDTDLKSVAKLRTVLCRNDASATADIKRAISHYLLHVTEEVKRKAKEDVLRQSHARLKRRVPCDASAPNACELCLSYEATVTFERCGHRCVCEGCSDLPACPVCDKS